MPDGSTTCRLRSLEPLQVYPVQSRFRHQHVRQGLSYLLAGSSLRPTIHKRELSLDLLCHSLHRTTFGGKYDGFNLSESHVLAPDGF